MRKREKLQQQYIECYEDEMYGTGATEVSREEHDMPPLIDADEDMEEVTLYTYNCSSLNFRITKPEYNSTNHNLHYR